MCACGSIEINARALQILRMQLLAEAWFGRAIGCDLSELEGLPRWSSRKIATRGKIDNLKIDNSFPKEGLSYDNVLLPWRITP